MTEDREPMAGGRSPEPGARQESSPRLFVRALPGSWFPAPGAGFSLPVFGPRSSQ